jgi:hypothetical protein
MKQRKTKAQSIVEYLLIFGGIILAIMAGTKMMSQKTKAMMNTSGQVMNKTAEKVLANV